MKAPEEKIMSQEISSSTRRDSSTRTSTVPNFTNLKQDYRLTKQISSIDHSNVKPSSKETSPLTKNSVDVRENPRRVVSFYESEVDIEFEHKQRNVLSVSFDVSKEFPGSEDNEKKEEFQGSEDNKRKEKNCRNLHLIFNNRSWDDLKSCLVSSCEEQESYFEKDEQGKTPLHYLGLNRTLYSNSNLAYDNLSHITDFMILGSNCKLLLVEDNQNLLPFQEKLIKWMKSKQDTHDQRLPKYIIFPLLVLSDIMDKADAACSESRVFMDPIISTATREKTRKSLKIILSKRPESMRMISDDDEDDEEEEDEDDDEEQTREEIEGELHRMCQQHKHLQIYVQRLAKMDNFMKKILYLRADHRQFAFDCSIIKEVMLRPESLGKWLVEMLNGNGTDIKRAVEYLTRLSTLLSDESKKQKASERKGESERGSNEKELHTKLLNLHGLMLSLVTLDHNDLRDLASKPIISNVVDSLFSTPLVALLLIVDLVGWLTLCYFYRRSIDGYLVGRDKNELLVWVSLTNVFAEYFGVREVIRGIAMIDVSKKEWSVKYWVRTTSFLNAMTLIMLAGSLFLVKSAMGENDEDKKAGNFFRIVSTVTTILLWLRFLTKLKSINIKFATFTTSIVQITKDIVWYLAILFISLVCFSQMFVTLLIPDDCMTSRYNSEDGIDCNPREYYLKVYSVLLGDWGLFDREDDFEQKTFALVVFVIFSFFIVIVMMNVVIAIIGESYNRCLEQSRHLFGRDRIFLVAELAALRNIKEIAMDQENNDSTQNDLTTKENNAGEADSAQTNIVHDNNKQSDSVCCLKTLDPRDWYRFMVEQVNWTGKGVLLAWILPFILSVTWLAVDFIGLKKALGDNIAAAIVIFVVPLVSSLFVLYKVLLFLSNKKMSHFGKCLFVWFGKGAAWVMSGLLAKERGDAPHSSQQLNAISERLRRMEHKMESFKRKEVLFAIDGSSAGSIKCNQTSTVPDISMEDIIEVLKREAAILKRDTGTCF